MKYQTLTERSTIWWIFYRAIFISLNRYQKSSLAYTTQTNTLISYKQTHESQLVGNSIFLLEAFEWVIQTCLNRTNSDHWNISPDVHKDAIQIQVNKLLKANSTKNRRTGEEASYVYLSVSET